MLVAQQAIDMVRAGLCPLTFHNVGGKIMKLVMFLILLLVDFISSPAKSQDYYLLIAMNSNKCAHVQAASQDNGGRISQWDCGSRDFFHWKRENVGGEYFQLRAMHSNKCAQVNGASDENGAEITQWDCLNQPHFHWKQVVAADRRGELFYYIINRSSGKCMHVHGASNDNGGNITQWECVDQPNVKWMLSGRTRID